MELTRKEQQQAVSALIDEARPYLPKNRDARWPLIATVHPGSTEPGEWQVGYTWRRRGSHHISGMTYDAVLGRGPTFADAVERASAKIARMKLKAENPAR